jgi:hypothetical protein
VGFEDGTQECGRGVRGATREILKKCHPQSMSQRCCGLVLGARGLAAEAMHHHAPSGQDDKLSIDDTCWPTAN